MENVKKLLPFVRPYWRRALLALVLLTTLVVLDLSIPRLIQRIIDQGILPNDQAVVLQTALLMLGISALSALIAIGNNNLSVQVGESVARDLRERLFLKIQSFSFGNLDRQKTGQLMVRLTSDIERRAAPGADLAAHRHARAAADDRQPDPDGHHQPPAWRSILMPLLLVTMVVIVFFIVQDGAAVPTGAAAARPAQHGPAGEHRRRAAGQGLRRAPTSRAERFEADERGLHRSLGAGDALHVDHVARADHLRQHRHGHRHLGGRPERDPGQMSRRADRGLHQLPADHDDAAHHDDHAVANLGAGPGVGRPRRWRCWKPSPRCRTRRTPRPLPADAEPQVALRETSPSTTTARPTNRCCDDVSLLAEPGQTVAILGRDRRGQVDAGQPDPALLRRDERAASTVDGADVRDLQQDSLLGARGASCRRRRVLFSGTRARQHPLWPARTPATMK